MAAIPAATSASISTPVSAVVFTFEAIATPFSDRKSTRLNSSHSQISYAVFCLKKIKCMFGTIAVLATGMPDGADILQSFIGWLASQQNSAADAASGLLLVSLIVMAVVTMNATFSATLATIRYDLIPAFSPNLAQPSDQARAWRPAVTAAGGVC